MPSGTMGKVLLVDLGTRAFREMPVPETVYERVMSGMGLAAHLLYMRIPQGADPLGPDNILGFVTGMLTGTGSLFAGRWMVVGKSPLTGGWGDANCGGNLAPAIKRCGYDGIFISGISDAPVYLAITKGLAEIRDAHDIWGRDTVETQRYLMTHSGINKPRVACIGPAGERLSLISGVVNDEGRIAARSGLGAVMGSKRLKALVLGGGQRIPVHDRSAIGVLSRQCNEAVQFQPPFVPGEMTPHLGALMRVLPAQFATDGMLYKIMLRKWGTVSMNQMSIEMGDAPIKNWKGSNEDFGPELSADISPDVFAGATIAKYHCYSCPLGCGGRILVDGRGEGHRPEYETVLSLGGLCMNHDAASVFTMNDMLNRAGMDTISAGGTMAFAMECVEKGILGPADMDGLELSWGNAPAMVALVEKMIRREGIGDILADGVRKAAQRIGGNASDLAMHAGGQELGMHDGRFDPGFALHNCVEPTPGRHTVGSQLYYEMFQLWRRLPDLPDRNLFYLKNSKFDHSPEKTQAAAACSQFMNVLNGAGLCLFGAFLGVHRFPVFEWLNAATGWTRSPADYMAMGKRVQDLRQGFNVRHGVDPRTFKMSDRALGRPPMTRGANAGRTIAIEEMMRDYWKAFGWDPETGVPDGGALTDALKTE
ncbi:MAG: aldehyde ferredoxin oxidoreductase family protein [Pseudomonadota bacterium]